MKKMSLKSIALLLALTLLPVIVPMSAGAAAPAKLNIALVSDTHYYPPEMAGDYYDVLFDNTQLGHPIEQTPGVLRSALEAIKARALRGEIDYLLIPGDLTTDGEHLGHERLAEILLDFERETFEAGHPVPVAVIPGNHDMGNGNIFVNGVKERAQPETTVSEFRRIYDQLGYDLPGIEFYTADLSVEGALSYTANLGDDYRLVALDTRVRRISPELRAWVAAQCRKAVEVDHRTVVAMGHHNLNEQFQGQLRVMQNQGIENMREISEEFADAGMHFYFSGHLHMSEISPWYSDSGEVLYDIIVPGLYSFPGDYRVVNFTAEGPESITADVQSYPVDEALRVSTKRGGEVINYKQPYYPDNLEFSFGYKGQGLAGFLKANLRAQLGKPLEELQKNGGIAAMAGDLGPLTQVLEYLDKQLNNNTQKIFDILGNLVDEAFALPVSKLPCTRFIGDLGFGDAAKPGTVADAGNSILVYMFWKHKDPAGDAFVQDVLRRMRNGELVDQVLNFAVPKVLDVLGAEILPLLANVDVGMLNRAMQCGLGTLNLPLLLVTALLPGTRDAISKTLYDFASKAIVSQSPSGRGTDAVLEYKGAAAAPTGPDTFRMPFDLTVTLGSGCKEAEVVWYTKESLVAPGLRLTGKDGKAVTGVTVAVTTEAVKRTVNQLDLGVAQMMGYNMQAQKHTAKISGLKPLTAYLFSVGDTYRGWWAQPRKLAGAQPVLDFFRQVWDWICGIWKLIVTMWNNRWYY
ncbi:MAG: metallophosphoesterase [Firmicutes bacterium]|nr:metallophosphoesterase [Bacillota bacterium]